VVPLTGARAVLPAFAAVIVLACSPEARRVRDGGPGADPGNKRVTLYQQPDPQAADTSLWPGRAAAPSDRMAAGDIPPPTIAPPRLPAVPSIEQQQRTFDRGRRANPERESGTR
jgi:hypothetical protein